MLLRGTRKVVGALCVWMSSSVVLAQPPAPETVAPSAPQESSYLAYDQPAFDDDLELWAQFRFQADWVYLTRQNQARNVPAFTGPESAGLGDVDFDYQSGYRLSLGFMNDIFELEGSFLEIDGLSGSQSGVLANALVFDGPLGFDAATPAARALVGLDPNFLTSSTLFVPINTAANSVADDETSELEYLDPGARYKLRYDSTLQDFDLNFKGRRQPGRLLRFGIGYRNIQFRELGSASLRGTFNTVDYDADETMGPAENDGLSNGALTGAGLTLASGAGGFFENTPPVAPDELLFTTASRTSNQLNGVQGTLDATLLETDYFLLSGYAKAGVYHNRAEGSVSEIYQDLENGLSRYSRSFRDSKDRVSFAGNLGVSATVFLGDNWRLFGGYELMYLTGLALGPDQADGLRTDLTNTTSLDLRTNGDAFFHGGRIGFEILLP